MAGFGFAVTERFMNGGNAHQSYWRTNIVIVCILLSLWLQRRANCGWGQHQGRTAFTPRW